MTEYRTLKITMTLENFNTCLIAAKTVAVERELGQLVKTGEISGADLALACADYLSGADPDARAIGEQLAGEYHRANKERKNDKEETRPRVQNQGNENPGQG
jgi:hypothetical protein